MGTEAPYVSTMQTSPAATLNGAPTPPKAGERISDSLRFSREELAEVGISAGGEGELAKFAAAAYSGQVVRRFYGRLVIDLDQLTVPRDKSPVLWMHFGDRVGYTTKVAVENGELRAEGVLLTIGESEHHDLARSIVHDGGLGYPWELSIGVDFDLEEVSQGETVEVNGATLEGPLFVGRRAVFRELSIVDVGADDSTFMDFLSRGPGGARFVERLAAAMDDTRGRRPAGARLMDVKEASASDIIEMNPEAAAEIKKAGAEEAAAAAEEAAEAAGEADEEPGESEGSEESGGSGGAKTGDEEEAAKGGSGAKTAAATIEQLRSLEGADDGFVLDAMQAKLSLDQARLMLTRHASGKADAALSAAAAGGSPASAGGSGGSRNGSIMDGLSGTEPEADYARSERLRSFCTGYFGNGDEAKGKDRFVRWAKDELAHADSGGRYDAAGLAQLHAQGV